MKYILIFIPCLLLVACATNKVLQATGGSKADGTVTLSYQYGGFEQPIVDWQQAQVNAHSRCQAWGYKNAESFGGSTSTCLAYNAYGCLREQVNVTYQCTD